VSAGTRCRDLGECRSCGKLRYGTRDDARHAGRIVSAKFGVRTRAYEHDGYWHLTSCDADRTAAYRDFWAWLVLPGRCEACGKPPYPSRGSAGQAAQEQMAAGSRRYLSARSGGVHWHVTGNRWHGRHGRGALRDDRTARRREAEERDKRALPGRRSTKRRAKRPRKDAPGREAA